MLTDLEDITFRIPIHPYCSIFLYLFQNNFYLSFQFIFVIFYLHVSGLFNVHRATLSINVIVILQKYGLTHLGNQSHLYLYGHRSINFADNRKHKRDSTLFNVSLLPYPHPPTHVAIPTPSTQPCRNPYPIHPTMSQLHLSFITFILYSFVSICEFCIYFFLFF